jgi:type VI secretion system protein ImpA
MASPSTLDFDRLLAPISGDDSCGADLRWEPVYQELKDARPKDDRSAFENETQQIADWNPLLELSIETLSGSTKDLMIAAWLNEALVHRRGFAGFRDGIKLINALLANFWDGLYPRPQDGDLEPRVAPLVFLTTDGRGARLPNMLRETALTPDSDEVYSLNYWKARQRREGESVEAFGLRAAEVAEKTQAFDEAVTRMSLDFTRNLLEDMQQGHAELVQLNTTLDEKFGNLAPGTTALRGALEECLQRVKVIYKDKGGYDEAGGGDGGSSRENGQAAGTMSGPIKSREDAFRRLAEVANFLRQKEPQNPIYLLVERAVLWSRMPFEQLLAELVKDSSARDQVGELLGLKHPPESE